MTCITIRERFSNAVDRANALVKESKEIKEKTDREIKELKRKIK